jgi:hypothetical protein
MNAPPRWTREQLQVDITKSLNSFRAERLAETLAKWRNAYDRHATEFKRLFADFGVANPAALTQEQIAAIFAQKLGNAFRYLAGPPISEDDLRVLADASLSPTILRDDAAAARRVRETIVQALDDRRFPWVAAKRPPTRSELKASIMASAALIAAQRVSTERRSLSKATQESAVKDFLRAIGFREVAARPVAMVEAAPARGEFCGESMIGTRKADIPVRLFDGRLMPIECKVSNSALNSIKRINNDAAVKAERWRVEFGVRQIVPAAVLSGVFKVENLLQAQDANLTIFWAHDLKPMQRFIEETSD